MNSPLSYRRRKNSDAVAECMSEVVREYTSNDMPRFLERLFDELVIAVDNVLGCHALFAGLKSDRHAVFVAAAYRGLLGGLPDEVACVDVGRYINAGEVADVHGAIGIWESSGDECARLYSLSAGMVIVASATRAS